MSDLSELLLTSASSIIVALGGRGAVSKWLERRAEAQQSEGKSLVGEVRAHGETKALVSALEARVEELERHNDEQASQWQRERISWEQERALLEMRIESLENILLRMHKE